MSFTKLVAAELEQGLLPLGFERTKSLPTKRVNSDASIRVSFNTASRAKGRLVMVNTFMQLQLDSVHQLGMRLGIYAKSSNSLASCLRDLAPKDLIEDYQFEADADNSALVTKAISDVSTYGLPVFLGLASVNDALQAVEQERIPSLTGIQEFVPLAQYLVGRRSDALVSAEKFLSRRRSPSFGSGKKYAEFVAALRKECTA